MKKVLVVDDTKNIRLLLTKCLELEGYEVSTAVDGSQAIELFKSNSYDLAFLDIKLPEVRGTEVLKRIRESGITTPVIIITAYGTVKNAVECTQMGAVAYLQKPFTADKIKTVLQELDLYNTSEAHYFGTEKYVRQAACLIKQEDFNKALGALKQAISIDPTHPETLLLFSEAYRGVGDEKNADKFYKAYELFSKE